MTHREFAAAMGTQFCGSDDVEARARAGSGWLGSPSVLDDADLEMLATNDVFWDDDRLDRTDRRAETVYDATVAGRAQLRRRRHRVHNSIEQDADMVILLHRDDVYEKESTRAGEADLIVAKHRNGPTRDITVAFQGHYSRFVDMAI